MKKSSKWWLIPIAVIVFGFLLCALFWPALRVYLAPKTVLGAALTDTYDSLAERTRNSPAVLIFGTLDLQNGNTADLKLDCKNDILGTIHYDMEVQSNWNPRQISAKGLVTSQGKTMDLAVYLDETFAAVSSAGLLQGNYYGLTYDTFGQDIRSNSLLSFALGETTIAEWEQAIDRMREIMSASIVMPSLREEDLRNIFVGIMSLSADVDREMLMLDGKQRDCFVISFETTGAQLQAGLDYLDIALPITPDHDDDIEISFWIQDGWVYRIEADAEETDLLLTFGKEDIGLQYETAGKIRSVQVHTQQSGDIYRENIVIHGEQSAEISYSWNRSGGEMAIDVTKEGERKSLSAILTPTESGFRMESSDFEGLMHLLLDTKDTADSPCVVNVSKGAVIETPSYKNFSQWSLEDFLTLLTGIGGLLGINFA